MTAVRRLLTSTISILLATSLVAQTTETPAPRTTEAVTAETDQDAKDPRAMQLSLDGAIRTSLERNLGITLQSYDYRMAGESLVGQYGAFDPFAQADIGLASRESAAVTQFESGNSKTSTVNFGVRQTLPTGATYDVGFDNSKVTRTGFGTSFSPAYSTNLNGVFTQPLLRDFGLDINRRGITIARNTLGINQELFRGVVMDTAVSVEQAYLDLVYARRAVDVVKESLFLARDQSRITQIRIDVGASAPLDILQPRVTIATSEEQLILAVANVRDAEDRLRQLLNLPLADWDRPIIPTDEVVYTPIAINMNTAVERAFQLRPEIRQQELNLDTRRVQYLFARNQTLPVLDLNLGYGAAGIGGRALDGNGNPDPDIPETRYLDALEQSFTSDFPSWNVGVTFGLPIFNIAARAEARRAKLDLDRSTTAEEQTRQTIRVEVRNAARLVETSSRTISATRAARDAAEQNLEAERRRYENGMTTNFQVLEIQQQLSDSRVRELQALVGYAKALSSYHRAVGDVLEVRNISLDEPEIAREPIMFSFLDKYNWLNYGSRVKAEEQTNDDDRKQ